MVLRKMIQGTQGPVYKRETGIVSSKSLVPKKALLDGRKDREEWQVCLGVNSERLPSLQ